MNVCVLILTEERRREWNVEWERTREEPNEFNIKRKQKPKCRKKNITVSRGGETVCVSAGLKWKNRMRERGAVKHKPKD